jgi:hypothetical protein
VVVLDTLVIRSINNNVECVMAFVNILLPQVRTFDCYDSTLVSYNVITHLVGYTKSIL